MDELLWNVDNNVHLFDPINVGNAIHISTHRFALLPESLLNRISRDKFDGTYPARTISNIIGNLVMYFIKKYGVDLNDRKALVMYSEGEASRKSEVSQYLFFGRFHYYRAKRGFIRSR